MKSNSNKITKILLVAIITLLIICVAIVATIYFLKDNFKSKKEIFANSIVQFMEQEETTNNNVSTYFAKKQTTPYENEGKIYIKIEDSEQENKEELENANKTKITFEGKTDETQKLVEQNIKIEYPQDITFPITYMQNRDLLGIQTNYISKKYIAIKNNNIKELAQNLEIDTTNIPDKINISTEQMTEEIAKKSKDIKEKYASFLDKITDDNITTKNTKAGKEYKWTLTSDIIDKILKDDNLLINKIYNNKLINNMNDFRSDNEPEEIEIEENRENNSAKSNITLLIKNGKPIKLELNIQNNSISIQKLEKENTCEYIINMSINNREEPTKIKMEVQIDGLKLQDKVIENYNIGIEYSGKDRTYKLAYYYENAITFANDIEIEELTQDNAMILNDYESDQISNVVEAIEDRLQEVNKEQMEKLGVEEDENPLYYFIDPLGEDNNILSNILQKSN